MNTMNFQECISCACFSARKTARLLTQHYDKYLRPSGLRATQYTLLVALILLEKPASMNQLSDLLGIEKTTLTRNLQTLEAQGHIRIESGKDKRTRLINNTGQGLACVKKAFPFWKKAQAAVAKSISPDILQELSIRAENIAELIQD